MIYTNLNNSGEVESVYAAKRAITTGTPPLSYPSKGYDLEDFLITGNTVQNGTPSPDYPVDVQGVGEKTENLFDKDTVLVGYRIYGGSVTKNSSYSCSDFIDVRGFQSIAKNKPDLAITTFYFYDSRKQYLGKYDDHSPAAIPSNASYVKVNMLRDDPDSFILVPGTIAPSSYIPYGYKIPVTIGNDTTPIYIGTVQTTRKIKKLVLTGSESYTYQSQYSRYIFTVQNAFADGTRLTQCFCTHYRSVHNGEPIGNIPDKSIYINYQVLGTQFCIKDEGLTSIADFKAYLAAQYAAGTPVTIWYVLAEPETAVVNEPLHRIGNYADTISLSQSGITVSTTAGTNTITTETTILPSSISVTTPEKEVSEIYAGINYQNPIFYSRKTLTGTSPLTFKGLGQPLKDYHIFGETVQNGTPSPDYPVDVQGVGEKTENLWDGYLEIGGLNGANGKEYNPDVHYYVRTDYIPALKSETPTLCIKATGVYIRNVFLYNENKVAIAKIDSNKYFDNGCGCVIGLLNSCRYIRACFQSDEKSRGTAESSLPTIDTSNVETLMLNVGGEPIPYEPYGYKIPVAIGNVTTPIYIGSDPLYRVGDYADEIDFANQRLVRRIDPTTMQPYATPITSTITVLQLAAAVGDNTLTVGTTVKPSAVSITGGIKPTGYGQLLDVNDVDIQDSTGEPIYIQG